MSVKDDLPAGLLADGHVYVVDLATAEALVMLLNQWHFDHRIVLYNAVADLTPQAQNREVALNGAELVAGACLQISFASTYLAVPVVATSFYSISRDRRRIEFSYTDTVGRDTAVSFDLPASAETQDDGGCPHCADACPGTCGSGSQMP